MKKNILKISAVFSCMLMSSTVMVYADPIQTMANMLPIAILNNTNIAQDSQIFIQAKGQDPTNGDQDCFMQFNTTTGVGTCQPVNATDTNLTFGQQLSTLPKQGNYYVIYVPKIDSGRLYISLAPIPNNPSVPLQPLYFSTGVDAKTGNLKINDPDGYNPQDPDYNVIYDKIELTYTDAGTWVDPTAVDFFSIPLSLSQNGAVPPITQSGFTESRNQILSQISTVFQNYDTTPKKAWNNLFVYYQNNNTGTVLRLMSPSEAMVDESGYGGGQPFDSNYLNDFVNTNNQGYIDNLFSYYASIDSQTNQPNTLSVDCSEIYPANTPQSTTLFTGHVESIQGVNTFVFTNQATPQVTVSIPENQLTSQNFYAGSGGAFNAPQANSPIGIIARDMSAAFEVGILPAPSGTILSGPNLDALISQYYQNNPNWGSVPQGPWYDLYAKAVHSISTAQQPQPIYAYAYDDLLGQSGVLHDNNNSSNTPDPVILTIGDMSGTTLPPAPQDDTQLYNVTAILGCANANDCSQVSYNGAPITSNEQFNEVPVPFTVQYTNSVTGITTTENIYFNPLLILPQANGITLSRDGLTNNVQVIFPGPPSPGNLGWATGWSSITGCGIEETGLNNKSGSEAFSFDPQAQSCVLNLVGGAPQYTNDQAQLTITYTPSDTITGVSCTYGNGLACATQPRPDPSSNVGIPDPGTLIGN